MWRIFHTLKSRMSLHDRRCFILTSSWMSRSHPAASRILTTAIWPLYAARCRGVLPFYKHTNNITIVHLYILLVVMTEITSLTLVVATLAPLLMSWTTWSARPLCEATRRRSESARTDGASCWLMNYTKPWREGECSGSAGTSPSAVGWHECGIIDVQLVEGSDPHVRYSGLDGKGKRVRTAATKRTAK